MQDKIKIEHGSVQETLIIPLYARKMCVDLFPNVFYDPAAPELCARLDYDFSSLDKKAKSTAYQFGALEGAMRQLDMAWEVNDYLATHPDAAIVNLGCGLDNTGFTCAQGTSSPIYNIDMPDIIAARNELMGVQPGEHNIACDLSDHRWMDEVDETHGVVMFAAGVFHYLTTANVRALALDAAERFPGGKLVFDAINRFGQKMMMKTILRNFDMGDYTELFSVQSIDELRAWSPSLTISQRPYMLGYNDMRDPSIKGIHRVLAKVGDKLMGMTIYRIDFLA